MNLDPMSDKLFRARQFAIDSHGDQMYGDEPYVVHLDAVVEILAPFGEQAQIVGYLHDVVEDTDISLACLRAEFGDDVAYLVALVTDEQGVNRKERKAKTNAKLAGVTNSPLCLGKLGLIVKAADRLANLRASQNNDQNSKLDMYRREHGEFFRSAYRPGLCDDLWDKMNFILDLPAEGREMP